MKKEELKKTPAKKSPVKKVTSKKTVVTVEKETPVKEKSTIKKVSVAAKKTTKKEIVSKNKVVDKNVNEEKIKEEVKKDGKKLSSETIRMIIVCGILAVLVILTFVVGLNKKTVKYEYQKHVGINEIDVKQYMSLIAQDGISIIYIARPSCSYCQMFEPILTKVLEENKIGVEYIDISAIATEEEWNTFYNSNEFLSKGEWGTPTILIYKDKEILNINSGYVEEDKLVSFLKDNEIIKGE